MYIIDFHSHILPGIDDGSRSIEMSDEMLKMSIDEGVNVQVLTPHFYASKMGIDEFFTKRDEALTKLIPIANQNKIHIRYGAEVAFFNNMSESEELERFLINGSRILLIEMPFRQWTDKDVRELEAISNRRILIMLAHLDRYIPLQKDKGPMDEIISMKVVIQINAESLTSFFGSKKVFKAIEGQSFVLGSDAHNTDSRVPNLRSGRDAVYKKLGEEALSDVDKLGNYILGYNIKKK